MTEVLSFLNASVTVLVAVGVFLILFKVSNLIDKISANIDKHKE